MARGIGPDRNGASFRGPGGAFAACLLWVLACPAAAEIFKCTDRAGNVTYQNEKCPSGGKAERVDVFDNSWTANRTERDAQWQRNAADRRVVTGMPAHWVREGFGEPAEVRDTTTGGATELWVYNFPDRSMQIGMLENQVLWFRETPVAAPVTRPASAPEALTPAVARASGTSAAPRPIDILQAPEAIRSPDAGGARDVPRAREIPRETSPGPGAPRVAELPRTQDAPGRIARGRDCREALAELGTPDRQREIPASDAGGMMTEYLYEPGGRADPTRTRILCANGKIEGVDRSIAR